MYVCWECWRAEMKFKRAFFFEWLSRLFWRFEIFSTYFSTQDKCRDICRVSRKIVEKIKKRQNNRDESREKKASLNFIGVRQHLQ